MTIFSSHQFVLVQSYFTDYKGNMKNVTTSLFFAASMATAFAQGDDTTIAQYLEMQHQANLNEDSHNANIYEKLAIMKHEGEYNPEYDWSDYKKLKSQLRDRSKKKFTKRAVEFFKASSNSDELRVCYVIDFSLSLKGKKEGLLRHEFTRSVNCLPHDTKVSSFMFAGPVWQLGDKMLESQGKKNYQVRHGESVVNWSANQVHDWTSDVPTSPAKWTVACKNLKAQLASQIKEQPLVWGTDWSHPLKAAMNQEPLPHVIYFMTDGSCNTANRSALEIAKIAEEKKVRINTIAMMEPKAEKPMKYLAAKTGGDFVVVNEKGECTLTKAGEVECPHLEEGDDNDKQRDKKKNKKGPKDKKDKKRK